MRNSITTDGETATIHAERKGRAFEVLLDANMVENLSEVTSVHIQKRHSDVYVAACYVKGTKNAQLFHRVLHNAKEGEVIDHIDGNALDNRSSNVRKVTTAENNRNVRRPRRKGKALPVCISLVTFPSGTKKYKVAKMLYGKTYNLGHYENIEDAMKVLETFEKTKGAQ